MDQCIDVLACPSTNQSLRWSRDGAALLRADAEVAYPFADGIARMLPTDARTPKAVQDFYDGAGWSQDDEGVFGDTRKFVDTRRVPFAFTRQCMRRLRRHFDRGGRYLLDAGSGPIAHPELLEYGERYERRICLDLSVSALRAARSKLGDKGFYVQGDLTRLPIKTASIDAITCNHVIYQIPSPDDQAAAFAELHRVLKPGGSAVIVYWWRDAPLEWRIGRLAALLGKPPPPPSSETEEASPSPVHAPQSLDWFQSRAWPFRFRLEPYRVITNHFLRHNVNDDWRGSMLLGAVSALQTIAPAMCGKYGAMPVILISKD